VLYSFCNVFGCYDGGNPAAGLTWDHAGNLFGTASRRTRYGSGGIFELTPNGDGTWTYLLRYIFGGGDPGGGPEAALTLRDGVLYTTTTSGGLYRAGVVFGITVNPNGGWAHPIYYFTGGKDGANPNAGLIFDKAGNLYGTATQGGAYGYGVVFKLARNPDGSWKETVLHQFTGGKDGANPNAGLIFDKAGNLYGTATQGGA